MPKKRRCPPSTSAAIPPTSVDLPIIEGRRETQNEETDPDEVFEEAGGKINVEEVEDFNIETNSLVAYFDDRNSARPCLGNVIEVTSEDGVNWMHLHLLQGAYSKPWKFAHNGVGKNRKPVTQWFDVKAAICWNLELTRAERLPPKMITYLQSLYSDFDQ